MATTTPIDLPRFLLALAKTEYFHADRLEDGCVEDVLLVKAVHGRRVDSFEDWETENVDDNTNKEAIEETERLLQIHAGRLVCHAALSLGYGEPPPGGVFPIHNFARTRQLWRGNPGGLADGERGTSDWFFPVGRQSPRGVSMKDTDNTRGGARDMGRTRIRLSCRATEDCPSWCGEAWAVGPIFIWPRRRGGPGFAGGCLSPI